MKKKYILCIDVGNTNTVFGLFDKEPGKIELRRHWRTVTKRDRTSDELGIYLLGFLKMADIEIGTIEGTVYSSVVPSFNPIVERMGHDYFSKTVKRITYQSPLPFAIDYPRPAEIGADRLVNAAAVVTLYEKSAIIVDMGTATTFCLLKEGRYTGGAIAPGIKLSIDTLSRRTAQLPPIEFRRPPSVIAKSTVEALQSGFFFGWIGLLRGIIEGIRREHALASCPVIATGGLSQLISKEEPGLFEIVDPQLTLKGLRLLYDRTDIA